MTSIQITPKQATILDSGDDSLADPIRRELVKQCQEQANRTGKTCEVYHPDGYVWDARSPNE